MLLDTRVYERMAGEDVKLSSFVSVKSISFFPFFSVYRGVLREGLSLIKLYAGEGNQEL